MAKILDKLMPSAHKRLISLRQRLDWGKEELNGLSDYYKALRERKIAAFSRRANAKLEKLAFSVCDKTAYADALLAKAMTKFDTRQYLSHRAAATACAKGIFAAIKEGRGWEQAFATFKSAEAEIAARRAEKLAKELEKREAFLAAQPAPDQAAYDACLAEIQNEYEVFIAALDAKIEREWMEKEEKLVKKLEALQAKIAEIQALPTHGHTLPKDTLLEVSHLCMYFGGLHAVEDLSFTVKKGEIFGLIGPNGAGKTTVFNCITRFYDATAGDVYFENKHGEVVSMRDFAVHDVVLQGIARTFQNIEVVKEVTVLDNLLIAATRQYNSSLFTQMLHLPLLQKEERVMRARADKVLKYMDLSAYRDRLCWGLPYGVLKRVEIARALMCAPKLIILDEPAAGLNESETKELAQLIDSIRRDFDCTILLVEHDMSLVMNICDHICAISFGKKLAYGTPEEVQASREVQEAYLGVGGDD